MNDKEYYLCSQAVIEAFPDAERSLPFKSGYDYEPEENYYIAVLDFEVVEKYYNEVIQTNNDSSTEYIDFWCRECVPGQMDVSHITLVGCRIHGLFCEIENKTQLTTERNRAMSVFELSQKYNCNPIAFIKKIVTKK